MSDLDAFICDRCKRQVMGRPVAYWTNTPFVEHSIDCGKWSLEFCADCTDEIQQAVGTRPHLPRADRARLLARLGLCR